MTSKKYDFVIIGAGSGGLTAARTAAKFGVTVALLEKNKIGGDCLHTGCVPSKSLISVARDIHNIKKTSKFMQLSVGELDFSKVHAYVHEKIHHIKIDSDNAEALANLGVDVYEDSFTFINKNTVSSSQNIKLTFKKAIIASGSRPAMPSITGLDHTRVITSDTVWSLTSLPKSLTIVGAGPIGLELGQAFAMLGTKVTILERSDRLLSRFDNEASDAISAGLGEVGVQVVYNASVDSIKHKASSTTVNYSINDNKHSIESEKLLVAIGRSPNTDNLGLHNATVTANERGHIQVNDKLLTSQKHIYAVGDCVGGPLFTHWAGEQGAAAVIHALTGYATKPSADTLPNATFTTPEIAQIGKTKQDLKSSNTKFNELSLPYSQIDKPIAEGHEGIIKVFVSNKGLILGAIIIGSNASELIGYIAYLKHHNKSFDSFSDGIQAYPTYTIGLKTLASDVKLNAIAKDKKVKFITKLRGF